MADGIAHQNKDIIFKILSENYKNKSLSVYGLDLPTIKEALPTNLPALKLDEKRADNIFLLENDTILILEYESSNDIKNLVKYGHYAFRVTETYYNDKIHKVVIVVIYTGDIQSATDYLDLGCMQLKIWQVFLSAFDGDKIYAELENKVKSNEPLSDEDVMRFIILLLTAKKDKQTFIETAVSLAKEISDEDKQSFIIAGILSATDKFIDKDYSNRLKEWLKMTKVGRLFEEEKLEYANEKVVKIAKKMLEKNIDILTIMETTDLSKAVILKLKDDLINTQS